MPDSESLQHDDRQRVAACAGHHSLLHDLATHVLAPISRIGEVAKEMLLATDYDPRVLRFRLEPASEEVDALYSLLALAEACAVNASSARSAVLHEYERRLAARGGVRSV